ALSRAAQGIGPGVLAVGHAMRWLRRRTGPVRTGLTALVTLLAALAGVDATITAVREALGTEQVLVTTRGLMNEQLASLCHPVGLRPRASERNGDRKSTRLNSSHVKISYAVFCLKKKKKK